MYSFMNFLTRQKKRDKNVGETVYKYSDMVCWNNGNRDRDRCDLPCPTGTCS